MPIEDFKCVNCGTYTMEKVGGIGKNEQLGEYREQENSDFSIWHATGIREQELYQCSECKRVVIK